MLYVLIRKKEGISLVNAIYKKLKRVKPISSPEAAIACDFIRCPLSLTHSAKNGTFMNLLVFPISLAACLV